MIINIREKGTESDKHIKQRSKQEVQSNLYDGGKKGNSLSLHIPPTTTQEKWHQRVLKMRKNNSASMFCQRKK